MVRMLIQQFNIFGDDEEDGNDIDDVEDSKS
jgi:hypothetical protein